MKSTGALAAAQLAVAGSERRGGRGLHSKAGQRLTRQPDLLMRTTTLRKQGLSGSKSQPSGLTLEAIGAARSKTGPGFAPAHPYEGGLARTGNAFSPPSRDRSPSARGQGSPAARKQPAVGFYQPGRDSDSLPPSLSASQQPSRDGSERDFGSERGKPAMVRRSSTARRLERRQNAVLMLIREQDEATADGFRDPSEDLELAGLVAPSGASGDLTSRRTEFSACATVTVDSRGGELGRLEDERSSLIGGDERSSCRASAAGSDRPSLLKAPRAVVRCHWPFSAAGRSSKFARKLSSESLPEETDELQALWDGDEEARCTGVDPSIREDDRATSFGTSCRDSARPSSVARHSFRVSFVGGRRRAGAHVLNCRRRALGGAHL